MEFVRDSFTDTGGTLLSSHTGEAGASWSLHPAVNFTTLEVTNANRIRPTAAGSATAYFASGLPSSDQYDVEADLVMLASNAAVFNPYVIGRMDPVANTFYGVAYDTGAAEWRMQKRVTGSTTTLGTFAQALAGNTTYRVKLELRQGAKRGYIDGVLRLSTSDNAIVGPGRVGLLMYAETISDTTGPQFDNVSAVDAGGRIPINALRPMPFQPGIAR